MKWLSVYIVVKAPGGSEVERHYRIPEKPFEGDRITAVVNLTPEELQDLNTEKENAPDNPQS